MKQWEDIVKERLEGYESTLPKGSLAEFQKLRAAGKATPRKKVYPLMWAAAVAVAASLVAVFFLRQPTQPEGGVQLVQQQPVEVQVPAEAVPLVADSLVIPEPKVTAPLLAQAAAMKPARPSGRPVIAQSEPAAEPQTEPAAVPQNEPEEQPQFEQEEVPVPIEEPAPEAPVQEFSIPTGSPFIPASRPRQKVNLKVALPVTGGVLGTSALALLASNMLRASHNEEEPASAYYSVQQVRFAYADFLNMDNEPQPPNPDTGTSEPVEKLLEYHFAFPLRMGLSTRIPVWNHLYLNTGFEYSRYTSDLSFLLAGAKTQVAQYLGIPLRMDWVFPMGKWFDAYAGAGLQADFCVGATWNGDAVPRDKINLSLGTAAGIQVNPRPHIGLFVEPQLSWRVPTTNDVLLTYRIQHPWMFSVSAGVRINLEKR
jgi:hypothetical protein